MLKEIKDYCVPSSFRFSYSNGLLDIVNYIKIVILEETRISLTYSSGIMVIRGKELRVKRLMDKEVLISGFIQTVELGDDNV